MKEIIKCIRPECMHVMRKTSFWYLIDKCSQLNQRRLMKVLIQQFCHWLTLQLLFLPRKRCRCWITRNCRVNASLHYHLAPAAHTEKQHPLCSAFRGFQVNWFDFHATINFLLLLKCSDCRWCLQQAEGLFFYWLYGNRRSSSGNIKTASRVSTQIPLFFPTARLISSSIHVTIEKRTRCRHFN